MTRIVAVHPAGDGYGSGAVFFEAVRAFSNRVEATDVFLGSSGPLATRLGVLPRVSTSVVPFAVLRKRSMTAPGTIAAAGQMAVDVVRCWRRLRALRPDIVYVSTLANPQWLLAARMAGIPSICHVHEAESQLSDVVRRAIVAPLRVASWVIVNSEATLRFVSPHGSALASKCTLTYNAVDVDRWPTSPLVVTPPIRLLLPGRLTPKKGHDVALRALRTLVDGGMDAVLQFAGDIFPGYEWYEHSLRTLATELGVADRVDFLGYVDDLASAYGDATVVIVPSRVESFGLVAAEAMCCGRPVIASNAGGLPEIVREGETGIIVDVDDVAGLAGAVMDLVEAPELAAKLAAGGRERVRAMCSRASFDRSLVETIERVSPRLPPSGAEPVPEWG